MKPIMTLVGRIAITSKETGYVRVEGQADDVFIDTPNLNTALHNDVVEIEGDKVVRIVSRAKTSFVGVLMTKEGRYAVATDDKKMYTPIAVAKDDLLDAKAGDKVVVKMNEWTDSSKVPTGEITRVLGRAGEHDVEMRAIVVAAGFEAEFPAEVEAEAEKIPKEITQEEIEKRRDFRNILTFTIDPAEAKDFDDALSFQELPDGTFEIGVHIADVSHYVVEDSALDKEAFKRATSIYLVDRTIPMLPEVLSNGLCSLNPKEDKLTFSAVFILDKNAEILDSWFGKTIIHSNHRFTYESAQEVLDAKEGPYFKELALMNKLAYKLREKKFKAGAMAFETEEVRFRLDKAGVPIEVYKKVRGDTHKLIEDYMLLANKKVAEFMATQEAKQTFVYRNHDLPDIDRIANLSSFIQNFGYSLKFQDNVIPSRELNDLITRVENTPEKNVIQTSVLRSMSKALYSTENIGHYSLAFEHYTHFTSPIRRYPDIMVHRLLQAFLEGKPPADQARYQSMCVHSSQREIEAADAERSSIRYKQVEYMKTRIGKEYDGLVTGVTKWGIYVETVQEKCEGMVRLGEIGDDFYSLDEKTYSLVGERTGRRIRLGDEVRVKVLRADMEKRTLDFTIV